MIKLNKILISGEKDSAFFYAEKFAYAYLKLFL